MRESCDGSQGERQTPEFGARMGDAAVLVVDDESGMRNFLLRTLAPRCKRVVEAADAEAASAALDAEHFDVVVIDNVMPGQSGVEWLKAQRRAGFVFEAILITAFADLDTAIEAIRAGAADFVLKPFRSNQLLNALARCLDRQWLARENYVLRYELRATEHAERARERLIGRSDARSMASEHAERARERLIGRSDAIERVRATIARVAPMPSTVLLTGESGTGKEVAARLVHALSDRSERPFVPVNCAAIPAEMIESELFGHVKGAFSGANATRQGLFLYAQGGTLFLDEIGELPMAMQSKLLRVLEDKRVRPVGSDREVPVDVRHVLATNADLAAAVAAGRFREDLYYRINVIEIAMPPLRARIDDVEALADLFMRRISEELGVPALAIPEGVRTAMRAHGWPGNVRELRNLIERSLIQGGFPAEWTGAPGAEAEEAMTLEAVERRHIARVLESVGGNRAAAARILGVSRKTVERKLAAPDG